VSKRCRHSDTIEKLEVGIVRVFSLLGFIVIVTDAAVTHIYPYLKHLCHVIFGP
jgi:hypothetical protein